jgi:hypothetical protein
LFIHQLKNSTNLGILLNNKLKLRIMKEEGVTIEAISVSDVTMGAVNTINEWEAPQIAVIDIKNGTQGGLSQGEDYLEQS